MQQPRVQVVQRARPGGLQKAAPRSRSAAFLAESFGVGVVRPNQAPMRAPLAAATRLDRAVLLHRRHRPSGGSLPTHMAGTRPRKRRA